MLKLIQVGNRMPKSAPLDPDPSLRFQPGMFGEAVIIGGQRCATVSGGRNPIGLIDDIRDGTNDTTIGSGRICLWMTPGRYATDQFEKGAQYLDGTPLCVGTDGRLTSNLVVHHPLVGRAVGVSGPGSSAVRSDGCVQFEFRRRVLRIR